jgi:hypothetical protein
MGWKAIQPAFWSAALVAALAATAQSPVHEPAPLGKMVDLNGYRIHLYCTGVGKQTVAVTGRWRLFVRLVFGPRATTKLGACLLV